MRPKLALILLVAASAMAVMILVFQPQHSASSKSPAHLAEQTASEISNSPDRASAQPASPPGEPRILTTPPRVFSVGRTTNAPKSKLERLAQLREQFHALAAGPPDVAMRAAKQVVDETERETALMALVTEWTDGNLRHPRERAEDIARFGIEAGLGLELVGNPQLAMAWADEMTAGPGRQALLTQTATALVGSDPVTAFAIGDRLPDNQKAGFFNDVFAGWGSRDTEAALQWANQLPDSAEREAAIQAIRTAAPVGIGTSVGMKNGYATIMELLPGTPAEVSGQLHPGDRILALAQGDNTFINAQGVPLADLVKMIRGQPGTTLQLQVISADAPPGAPPQTVSIIRDQIKFKR